MDARNWNLLYQRQPIHLDVILLLVALLLHLPLAFVHMTAPPKRSKGKAFARLVNIDFVEEQIKKRKAQPVVLPPKMPEAPKQLQNMVKKVEEVKQQMFKRSMPPPPMPQPKLREDLIKGPEASKLQESLLKNKLEQDKKVLQGKGSFQGKELKLSGPDASRELKLVGGGAASLQAASRLAGMAGPQGPALKGKSGFQVSQDAAPMSIGGGDEGGLKVAGGVSNVVVLPTGNRAKADASILSPVARDRGSLQAKAPDLSAGPAGKSSSISLGGTGGAAPIATPGGSSRLPVPTDAALPKKEAKKFDSGSVPNPLADAAKPVNTLPGLPTLIPRRTAPKVQKPLFLITGPLANRKTISRQIPEYPEWARTQGIESAVIVQFTVTPDGAVKDNMLVVRTSGYPQLDELAMNALKNWKFIPLPADQFREEIGTITFNFSIH